MQNRDEKKLVQIFEDTIEYYINNIQLSQATFPLLKLTYSLWRSNAYNLAQKKINKDINYPFFLISERKYLREYINKIEKQMNKYYKGLSNAQENFISSEITPSQQRTYEMTLKLGQSIWEQQLYLQLIQDLIFLPYLQIFPKNTCINVRNQYRTNFSSAPKKPEKLIDKVCDKVSQSIFKTTLSTITQFFLSKAFIFQVQTLVGTFNPLMMGASYGLGQYLNNRGKQKKEEELIVQLENAYEFSLGRVKKLKQNYERCLQLINIILSGQCEEIEEKKKKLKKLFLVFYEEEWLQIEVELEGEWEVVKITEKQQFQELYTSVNDINQC